MAKGLKLKDAHQASSNDLEVTTNKGQLKLQSNGGGEHVDLGENNKEIDLNDVISGVPKFQEQLDQMVAEKTAQEQEVTLDDISEMLSKEGVAAEPQSIKDFFKAQKIENSKDFMESLKNFKKVANENDNQDAKNQQSDNDSNPNDGNGNDNSAAGNNNAAANSNQANQVRRNLSAQSEQQEENERQNQQQAQDNENGEAGRAPQQNRFEDVKSMVKERLEQERFRLDENNDENNNEDNQQETLEETEQGAIEKPYEAPELKEATLSGDDQNNRLRGSAEDDVIHGGKGNDDLYGNEGNDTFQVVGKDQGADDYFGGDGYDTIEAVDGADIVIDGNLNSRNSIEKISGTGDSAIQGDDSNNSFDFSNIEVGGVSSIDGGAGNDTIKASQGNDNVFGGEGNDRLYGNGGNDTLSGGAGNDRLYGGDGDDTLIADGQGKDYYSGGEGNDTIEVTGDNDLIIDASLTSRDSIENIKGNGSTDIVGDESNNTIDLRNTDLEGIDRIRGGEGNDRLYGNDADNHMHGGEGNDQLYGGGGDDILEDRFGNNRFDGGDGNDTFVTSGEGNNQFYGGDGQDTIQIDGNADLNIDTSLTQKSSIEKIVGNGSTDIVGDESNNTIDLRNTDLEGIDRIRGGEGNDRLYGNDADNHMHGGEGNDQLYGGGGDDILEDRYGNNRFDGGDGNDTFVTSGEGNNQFYGGDGQDTIQIDGDADLNIDTSLTQKSSIEKIVGNGSTDIVGDESNNTIDLRNTDLEGIDRIRGGEGNDRLYGNDAGNHMHGGEGNDQLYGGGGDDILEDRYGNNRFDGGDGNDTFVTSGEGKNQFYGGDGQDTIQIDGDADLNIDTSLTQKNSIEKIVGSGSNDIAGDESNNTIDLSNTELEGIRNIDGGAGNDNIKGNADANTILGGEGNDSLYGNAGNDSLSGGAGNDRLYGGDGDDTLLADGQGNDYFHGGEGYDTIEVAKGADLNISGHLRSNESIEKISGDGSTDILGDSKGNIIDLTNTELEGIQNIDGGAGNDTIKGNADANTILGGDGNDSLYGNAGNDTLSGGAGNDRLYGGEGDDTLLADGQGNDYFHGGDGYDTIEVADGADLNLSGHLRSNESIEKISGDGNTDIVGDSRNNSIDLTNTELEGIDEIDGGAGNDYIKATANDDTVHGGEGNDRLYGQSGNDTLYGDAGNDTIYGGDGNDTIYGGDGDDQIYAGGGDDTVSGGAGFDTLNFSGRANEYEFFQNGDSLIVQDSVAGRDGQIIIEDIDSLKFRGSTLDFDSAIADAQDISVSEETLTFGSQSLEAEESWDQMVEDGGDLGAGSEGSWDELVDNDNDDSSQDDGFDSDLNDGFDQPDDNVDGVDDYAA